MIGQKHFTESVVGCLPRWRPQTWQNSYSNRSSSEGGTVRKEKLVEAFMILNVSLLISLTE